MTAAFTGHRYIDARKRQRVKETLKRQIVEAYGQGFRNFMSGFALGFDMMAAETVVSLRETCPGIILTAAIPFKGQPTYFSSYDKRRYNRLLCLADEVMVLSETYFPRCFLERDEFMVSHSSFLIAYYDGRERGGTFYTVKKAREQGLPVANVF